MKVRGNEGRVHRHGALRDGRPVLVFLVGARRLSRRAAVASLFPPPWVSVNLKKSRSQSKEHRTGAYAMCTYTCGERKPRASPKACSRALLSNTCSERDLWRANLAVCADASETTATVTYHCLPFFFFSRTFRLWSSPRSRGACEAFCDRWAAIFTRHALTRRQRSSSIFPHVFLFPPNSLDSQTRPAILPSLSGALPMKNIYLPFFSFPFTQSSTSKQ